MVANDHEGNQDHDDECDQDPAHPAQHNHDPCSIGERRDKDMSSPASISTQPKLPIELIERILVHAIRLTSAALNPIEVLFKWPLPAWFADPPTAAAPQLQQFLHVLPTNWAPRVARAAFPRFLHCTSFYASYKGRADLLDMRLQFDLDLTDIQSSLYLATLHGHVCILDWWQDNAPDDMPLYLSWNLIYAATKCTTGEPDVLDWWLASRWLVPEYLSDYTFGDALQVAARVGHVRILDYAANQSYLRVPVEHLDGLDGPSRAGQVAVLEWWVKSGWTVMYSVEAIVGAAEEGRLDVLEWWARSGLEIKLPRDWDAFIARIKDPAVVEWLGACREHDGARER
ncbi:hypothetical protein AMAG_13695 [Allomyces macrogynus ATCC 38327]|uniref:Uncharacterized protein n=1 Tax=Allomyces macrogynus (strain ATCC 38327) TaxID=578462 RepID=A0A0L0T396_ALLM3|nr:hypothetical protein AMAG_13695 [Allomyces macrogynus ATCC 38327]|eukprot:KNE69323.1 hypothetical protein AMAG_13695 [Allomyces macrogynus ATCC 38327]